MLASCPNLELGLTGVLLNLSGPSWIRTRPVRFRLGSIAFLRLAKRTSSTVTQNPTVFEARVFNSGTRTRTGDVQIMGLASYLLLHPAM